MSFVLCVDQRFCQDFADMSFIVRLASWAEMFAIMLLGVFTAVFLASVSAFLLPSIDECPGIHISFTTFPLAWWAEIAS